MLQSGKANIGRHTNPMVESVYVEKYRPLNAAYPNKRPHCQVGASTATQLKPKPHATPTNGWATHSAVNN